MIYYLMDNAFIISHRTLKTLLIKDGCYPCFVNSEIENMIDNECLKIICKKRIVIKKGKMLK